MERAVRAGIGVVLLKNNSGKRQVLLGKRKSNLFGGKESWSLPGGKLEFGETLENCAKRETFEETGLKITGELKLIGVSEEIDKDSHFITIGFLCKKFSGEPRVMEMNKIVGWKWFDLNALPRKLFLPTKHVLELLKSSSR